MDAIIVLMVLLGIMLLLLLICIALLVSLCVWWFIQKIKNSPKGFDERQIACQGKAYRLSTIVGVLWLGAVSIFIMTCQVFDQDGPLPINPVILLFAGMTVMNTCHSLYCAMTDALFTPKTNVKGLGICTLICGLLLTAVVVYTAWDGGMPLAGRGSLRWIHLITALHGVVMGCVCLIAHYRSSKKKDTNENQVPKR